MGDAENADTPDVDVDVDIDADAAEDKTTLAPTAHPRM